MHIRPVKSPQRTLGSELGFGGQGGKHLKVGLGLSAQSLSQYCCTVASAVALIRDFLERNFSAEDNRPH